MDGLHNIGLESGTYLMVFPLSYYFAHIYLTVSSRSYLLYGIRRVLIHHIHCFSYQPGGGHEDSGQDRPAAPAHRPVLSRFLSHSCLSVFRSRSVRYCPCVPGSFMCRGSKPERLLCCRSGVAEMRQRELSIETPGYAVRRNVSFFVHLLLHSAPLGLNL